MKTVVQKYSKNLRRKLLGYHNLSDDTAIVHDHHKLIIKDNSEVEVDIIRAWVELDAIHLDLVEMKI